jgi:hypothetical protein
MLLLLFCTTYFLFLYFRHSGSGDVLPISQSKALVQGMSHQVTVLVDPEMLDLASSILSSLEGINLDPVTTIFFNLSVYFESWNRLFQYPITKQFVQVRKMLS